MSLSSYSHLIFDDIVKLMLYFVLKLERGLTLGGKLIAIRSKWMK